jgi:uncharacterized membrane protein YgcG
MSGKDAKTSGKVRFKEQCYLLWNWSTLTKANASATYENMAIIEGEPSDVINKLVSQPGLDRLFQLKPFENAALVPLIKLYKTTYGDSESTQEIRFNNILSSQAIESIMSTKFGRGDGIGIKNVSYDLQGASSTGGAALVKKGVTQVDITFTFQNLEMLVQREGGGPALIDLVTFPPGSTTKKAPECAEGSQIDFTNVFDAGKFAIKLVYGYATPDSSAVDQDLKSIIENSATTLLLNLQRHQLDFKQDGTVELKCQYMGYSDSMMNRPEADIFYLGAERNEYLNNKKKDIDSATEQLNQAKNELKAAEESLDDGVIEMAKDQLNKIKDEGKKLEGEQKEAGEDNKIFVYQRLMQALYDSGKIFLLDLDEDQVNSYLEEIGALSGNAPGDDSSVEEESGIIDDIGDALGSAVDAVSDFFSGEEEEAKQSSGPTTTDPQKADVSDLKEQVEGADTVADLQESLGENKSTAPKDADKVRINYMYYGDLLNVVFGVLSKNPEAASLRPMLGPIAFSDPKSGQSIIASLADVPISLNKFLEWFNKNVVAQGRQEYLLEDFVRDTIKDLIHAALGEGCFPGTGYPAPEPNVTVSSIPVAKSGGSSKIPMNSRVNVDQISVSGPTSYQDANKLDQYIYIYAYTFGLSNLNGDRDADHKRGIYHLQVGADRGLVKKVGFSRIDDPKLAASRATSVKCDLRHLRENYKANVDMIGNSLFKPGQTIYINPTLSGGPDPQLTQTVADALGLGGYYTVVKVSGDLGPSGFNTSVEAIWESGRQSRDAGAQLVGSNSPSKGGVGGTGDGQQGGSNPAEPFVSANPLTSGGGGEFGGGGASGGF